MKKAKKAEHADKAWEIPEYHLPPDIKMINLSASAEALQR